MKIIGEITRTLTQIPERGMRAPLVKGILATALALVAIAAALGIIAGVLSGGLALVGLGLGGLGFVGLLYYAFIPAAALAVSFFVDPVADAVEARHYRDAPPPRNRPLSVDLALSAKFVLIAVLINIPLAPFYWVFPPLPAAINGYLLGREFFELVARRRHDGPQTAQLRRSVSGSIWIAGACLAFAATIPLLNLAAPVFGMALITHVYHRARLTDLPVETDRSAV